MTGETMSLDTASDPAELERKILSGNVHEGLIVMLEALRVHFKLKDLQDLTLLDTCQLYCDLRSGGER